MGKLNNKQVGLTLAIFFAALHAVWAILVGLNLGQGIMDWIFPLHFLNNLYTVLNFSLGSAVMLVIMAFIAGYAMGWLFAALNNWVITKVK